MGWTSYHADFYDRRGNVDRKRECDNHWDKDKCIVLKSQMVGSTYYAAIQKKDTGEVFAAIVLTSVDNKDYYNYNFSYKSMDDTYGPNQTDCPKSILKLLSPTDNEVANNWRKQCYEQHERKAKLSKLPIGSIVRYARNGTEYTKSIYGYNKRVMWINWEKREYIKASWLVKTGYEVVYSNDI